MPEPTAPPTTFRYEGVKQTDGLIVSFARSGDIRAELKPVFKDLVEYYTEKCDDIRGVDLSENMVASLAVSDIAVAPTEYYQRWFDVAASLVRGSGYGGRYMRMANLCIMQAFTAMAATTGDRSLQETSVIDQWAETLIFS